MIFDTVAPDRAEGGLLVHTTRLPGSANGPARILKKGHVLNRRDVADLRAAGIAWVSIVRIEPGDTGEDETARRMAEALAGDHLRRGPATTGRCNLYAAHHGLLQVDRSVIDDLNRRNMGVLASTLQPDIPVEHGRMVATVKVIPFSVREAALAAAEASLSASIRVRPFQPLSVGLIQTRIPAMKTSLLTKGREVMAGRVETYGGRIMDEIHCDHEADAVARSITAQQGAGAQLILVLGGASTADAADVVPAAMTRAGGRVIQFGIPMDPGNLLSLGLLDQVPVVGLPGCSRSPRPNGADRVLDWLFAGLPADTMPVMDWGVGGLLEEVSERLQRREPAPRAEPHPTPDPKPRRVAAVILAAGQSRRFGTHNKLLALWQGRSLIRHGVTACLESRADPVIIVTGHEADLIRGEIGPAPVRFVHNPHYGEGLATSLRVGIGAAAEEGVDGALVMLGDMPRIDSRTLDGLMDLFEQQEGGAICVPHYQGRRGNPVLWPRDFFAEIMETSGDTGARGLLARHAGRVRVLALDSDAVVMDVDTPQALKDMESGPGPSSRAGGDREG